MLHMNSADKTLQKLIMMTWTFVLKKTKTKHFSKIKRHHPHENVTESDMSPKQCSAEIDRALL